MNTYKVGLQLTATDPDELLARIHSWEIGDDEGVLTITQEPEKVAIPVELLPPTTSVEPPIPITSPPLEPDQPDSSEPEEPEPDDGGRELYSAEPDEGPTNGGFSITLHGEGLTGIGGVKFVRGDQEGWAWGFTVVDDETVQVTTPQMSAGLVDIVLLAQPDNVVLEDGFTFV